MCARLLLIHTFSNNNFDEPDLENAYATMPSAFLVFPADCVSTVHSCVDHSVARREIFSLFWNRQKKSTPWAYRPPIDGPCQLQGWHFRPNLRLEFSLACSCFSLASSCEGERESTWWMGGFSFSHRCEQEGAFLARSFLTLVEVLSAEWTNFYKSFPFFTFDYFVQVNYVLGNFLFICWKNCLQSIHNCYFHFDII